MLLPQQTLIADITPVLLCICVKSQCVCVCERSVSLHVSICVLVRVCGWAPCQPLSDSTPSCWRIFVSETNGTERINYCHNAGDMPELPGGGGENKPFPCTLRFHPPPALLLLLSPPRRPMSTNGRLKRVTCPFSSRHQATVEHRREMAPIPDTPQKPQSHPVIREAQDPTSEAEKEEKDTLRLGNIAPLHHSVWQYFNIRNLALQHCSSCSHLQ